MIKNGKDFRNNERIHTQVCIVGSGPAGITAAWHLQKAGVKVILIEGSRDYGSDSQASWPDKVLLYNGKADGLFADNEPQFLISPFDGQTDNGSERERVFGGTSAHWAGQCRPLDAVTFRQRPGFPKWPIDRADLDPWYTEAAAFLGIDSNFTAEHWAKIPKDGVVDANLKIHSLRNLYVAGSSVFASAGISNPTFTIVTLSIRLAAHLSQMLRKQPA